MHTFKVYHVWYYLGILIATYLTCLLTCFVTTAPIMCSMNISLLRCSSGWTGPGCSQCIPREGCCELQMSTVLAMIIVWFLFMAQYMGHAHYQEIATAMLTGVELRVLLVCLAPCCLQTFCYCYCCSDLIPCQTNSPCRNGTTCSNSGAGGYHCSCAPGYHGTDCQYETNECLLNRCMHGATCVVSIANNKVTRILDQSAYTCFPRESRLVQNRLKIDVTPSRLCPFAGKSTFAEWL